MKAVSSDVSFPALETSVMEYWRESQVFKRSLDPALANVPCLAGDSDGPRPEFIFYDGPPFATGLPHHGHLLPGTIKDAVGRFFTMKGYRVERRFGWDCHGVPVEVEVQKQLGLNGAKEIREFGIPKFNEACREIVLRYTREWREFVERSGRWADMDNEYRTMDRDFMESVWWVVKRLWDRGLIYKGVKCVPYSWALSTPLSNLEAGLEYQTVQDPAVTIRARALGDIGKELGVQLPNHPVNFYLWTTTPWTLPANLALAVNPELSYSLIEVPATGETVIVGTALRESIFPALKEESPPAGSPRVITEIRGVKLVGLEYEPLFPYFADKRAEGGFKIYPGEFVTDSDGTGIVHLAAFGEDDVRVFTENKLPIVDPVSADGVFLKEVTDFAGLNIKEADPKIIQHLKASGKLVSHKTIEHSYPFCYRTHTPLIYKTIPSWFVSVEKIKTELLQLNSITNWVPEHLRDGRFGNILASAPDWAISRNRFWGNPLPIWECGGCDSRECLGSASELEERGGRKVADLHSHFIDDIRIKCGKCGSEMKRIPEVLDCWFESGSMPYAQAHYPFEGKERFERNFPADFIAESIDQTRGWFNALMTLSTALFGRPAFKNVIVSGMVTADDGKKMSKSAKNYAPPAEIFTEIGADALRLYLLASPGCYAEEFKFSKDGVVQSLRGTLLPLWNAYNFFVTYALVDKWTPAQVPVEPSSNLLDRWILSRLSTLITSVDNALSHFRLSTAVPPVLEFVDQLTNWYIRLNRRRFWSGTTEAEQIDKLHAYATLHRVLLTFVRVLAPLAPFISEEIFRNLKGGVAELNCESVHLSRFPRLEEFSGIEIDHSLERAMEMFEEVILLGRSVRNDLGLKVRQPLRKLTVLHPSTQMLGDIRLLDAYIREELNVKEVEYSTDEEQVVTLSANLNTKTLGSILGPKLGSDGMKELRNTIAALTTEELRAIESGKQEFKFKDVVFKADDLVFRRQKRQGVKACATSGLVTVVLDTDVSRELKLEGLAREFVNRVQKLRKESGLDVADRVAIAWLTACPHLALALQEFSEYIAQETLAVELQELREEGTAQTYRSREIEEIDGKRIVIALNRVQG